MKTKQRINKMDMERHSSVLVGMM